jgi:hypothetical protein
MTILLMAITLWLLVIILLVAINDYSIGGY